jgi:late competence protein required for DNA uptake (superfamily II DNA/RNA helicase)
MTEKHVHKYKRLKYKSGNFIFFCALPDCNQKINISLALGKRSLCWRCGSEFIMTEYSLRLAKPHCNNCLKSKFEGTHLNVVVTDEISALPQSLSERLQQVVNQVKPEEEEEI